jgi:hypothetical protein
MRKWKDEHAKRGKNKEESGGSAQKVSKGKEQRRRGKKVLEEDEHEVELEEEDILKEGVKEEEAGDFQVFRDQEDETFDDAVELRRQLEGQEEDVRDEILNGVGGDDYVLALRIDVEKENIEKEREEEEMRILNDMSVKEKWELFVEQQKREKEKDWLVELQGKKISVEEENEL